MSEQEQERREADEQHEGDDQRTRDAADETAPEPVNDQVGADEQGLPDDEVGEIRDADAEKGKSSKSKDKDNA